MDNISCYMDLFFFIFLKAQVFNSVDDIVFSFKCLMNAICHIPAHSLFVSPLAI